MSPNRGPQPRLESEQGRKMSSFLAVVCGRSPGSIFQRSLRCLVGAKRGWLENQRTKWRFSKLKIPENP